MEHPDYNSPSALSAFLDEHQMAMQKKFGQNFLVNAAARKKLIDGLDVGDGMPVWEVGPGLGCMTKELLDRGAHVAAFEIDYGFARILRQLFAGNIESGVLELVEGDVMKTWKPYCDSHGVPARFFGNLPYNIAATIIAGTINEGIRFEKAVVTVQKEVAQRMTAKEGTAQYSSFSVLCQWAYRIETVLELAGGNFWPVPNVASRAVLMEKRADFPQCRNPALFMKLIRQLFASRRKTVRNNLLSFAGGAEKADCALERARIEPSDRAECLSVGRLLRLADELDAVQ